MGKWYAGKVAAYDGRSAKHTILYKDGDVQQLTLRQEAVVWPEVPGLDGPGLAARLAGEADTAEVRAYLAAVMPGWIFRALNDGPSMCQLHYLGGLEVDLSLTSLAAVMLGWIFWASKDVPSVCQLQYLGGL